MYTLRFYAYCGMHYDVAEDVDKEEAKSIIRGMIARCRERGKTVTKIAPGRWEFETPDTSSFVADNEGTLAVLRSKLIKRRR